MLMMLACLAVPRKNQAQLMLMMRCRPQRKQTQLMLMMLACLAVPGKNQAQLMLMMLAIAGLLGPSLGKTKPS